MVIFKVTQSKSDLDFTGAHLAQIIISQLNLCFMQKKKLRLSSLIDRSKSLDELAHDLELFNSDYIIIRFNIEKF